MSIEKSTVERIKEAVKLARKYKLKRLVMGGIEIELFEAPKPKSGIQIEDGPIKPPRFPEMPSDDKMLFASVEGLPEDYDDDSQEAT